MLKQKAPKDMTAVEFVAHLEIIASREMLAKNLEGWAITLQGLRKELSEPAPNPFTPDQLAWMRVEQIYRKINYAACENNGTIVFFEDKPNKSMVAEGRWASRLGYREVVASQYAFLADVLSPDDTEPLCFADYAPLEEK